MQKSIGIFATIILASTICAIKFSRHPMIWLIVLTAAIPIYAAVAGGLMPSNRKKSD